MVVKYSWAVPYHLSLRVSVYAHALDGSPCLNPHPPDMALTANLSSAPPGDVRAGGGGGMLILSRD